MPVFNSEVADKKVTECGLDSNSLSDLVIAVDVPTALNTKVRNIMAGNYLPYLSLPQLNHF